MHVNAKGFSAHKWQKNLWFKHTCWCWVSKREIILYSSNLKDSLFNIIWDTLGLEKDDPQNPHLYFAMSEWGKSFWGELGKREVHLVRHKYRGEFWWVVDNWAKPTLVTHLSGVIRRKWLRLGAHFPKKGFGNDPVL